MRFPFTSKNNSSNGYNNTDQWQRQYPSGQNDYPRSQGGYPSQRTNYSGGTRNQVPRSTGYSSPRNSGQRRYPNHQDQYTQQPQSFQEVPFNRRTYSPEITSGKKRSWAAMQYVGIAVVAIIAILFVIKAVQIIFTGIGPAIEQFQMLMATIFERFIGSLIAAVVIYVLVNMFFGNYIPFGIKKKIIPICLVLLLLYSIAPALASSIGQLLIMLAGIIILFTLLK